MNLQSLREVNPFFCEELVLHLHKITESISTMSTISTFAYFAKRIFISTTFRLVLSTNLLLMKVVEIVEVFSYNFIMTMYISQFLNPNNLCYINASNISLYDVDSLSVVDLYIFMSRRAFSSFFLIYNFSIARLV